MRSITSALLLLAGGKFWFPSHTIFTKIAVKQRNASQNFLGL